MFSDVIWDEHDRRVEPRHLHFPPIDDDCCWSKPFLHASHAILPKHTAGVTRFVSRAAHSQYAAHWKTFEGVLKGVDIAPTHRGYYAETAVLPIGTDETGAVGNNCDST